MNKTLLHVLVSIVFATVLAGCTVLLSLPLATSWTQLAILTGVLALLALVVFAVRRQRTVNDDTDVAVRRALSKYTTDARYTYCLRDDTATGGGLEVVYEWDAVDRDFPLGWRTGFLAGKTLSDMLPEGPDHDEARAAYMSVLQKRVPATYIRSELDPHGRLVTVRYSHVPMPNGRGACVAVPLSPQIDAVRDERDRMRLDNKRLEAQVVTLTGDVATLRESARRERALYAAQIDAQAVAGPSPPVSAVTPP